MALTKDQILQADDKRKVEVDVAEWGGKVWLRTMTGAERDSFEQLFSGDSKSNLHNVRAKLLSRVLCDEDGKRLFSDGEVNTLGERSGMVLDRLFDQARELNGMGDAAVENAAKN